MANREVDTIVHDLQGMRSGQDFSQVARELRDLRSHDPGHFQRNLDQINQSVDMRNLGFPEDFKIAGVNDRNIMTTSADNSRLQQRDMQMHVRRDGENPIHTEQMGSRQVTENPNEHSRQYTTQRGDTLWSIARDSAQHDLGRLPSATEINSQVQNIARENNITNPNHLMQGTELRLPNTNGSDRQSQNPAQTRVEGQNPAEARRADGPYSNAARDSAAMQPRDGVANPVAVPGLAADGDPSVARRDTGLTERRPDGSTVTNFSGKLNDGYIYDTRFTAQQQVDSNGRLVHNEINYQGSGADIRLQTPTGEQTVNHVNKVETNYNNRTGRYETTLSTTDGARYNAVTGRDGRVISYIRSQEAGQ